MTLGRRRLWNRNRNSQHDTSWRPMVFDHGEGNNHDSQAHSSCIVSKHQSYPSVPLWLFWKCFRIIDDGSTSFSCEGTGHAFRANAVLPPPDTHPTRWKHIHSSTNAADYELEGHDHERSRIGRFGLLGDFSRYWPSIPVSAQGSIGKPLSVGNDWRAWGRSRRLSRTRENNRNMPRRSALNQTGESSPFNPPQSRFVPFHTVDSVTRTKGREYAPFHP
jgi:hypothetical protein